MIMKKIVKNQKVHFTYIISEQFLTEKQVISISYFTK
jgi:hypothetical protein